jgi:hypothetical protein
MNGLRLVVPRLIGCRCPFKDLSEARQAFALVSQSEEDDLTGLAGELHVKATVLLGLRMICRYCLRTLDLLDSQGLEATAEALVRVREENRAKLEVPEVLSKRDPSAGPSDEFQYYAGAQHILLKVSGWQHL